MEIIDIIEKLGGDQRIAMRFKVHQNSITYWCNNGIPPKYWRKLIVMSRGWLSADILLTSCQKFYPMV